MRPLSLFAAFSTASALAPLAVPTLNLADGNPHPMLGYGTYKVGFVPASASAAAAGAEDAGATAVSARGCVRDALEVGYRFLDCAEFYGNEAEVGAAIADVGASRDELFLASKCWTTTIARGPEAVLPRTAPRVSAERRRATSLPSCVSNAQPVTVMRPPRSAKTAVRTLRKVVPRASREHSASQICTADDAVEMVQSTSSSRAPGCGEVHFSTHTRWLGEGEALLRDCARGRAA